MKTLSDPLARDVDPHVVTKTTIADLNALPAQQWAENSARHSPEETTVYEVSGIVREVKTEGDRDIHIVLEDRNALGTTLIIELVDPTCNGARDSPYLEALTEARRVFVTLLRSEHQHDSQSIIGRRMTVRGPGFYDLEHSQKGRAKSNLELHPVMFVGLE